MSEKNEDFGLTTWDEETTPNFRPNTFSDDFLRLQPGNNRIRILTKPFGYYCHKFKAHEKDPGFGSKILCSKKSKTDDSCPLCTMGVRRSRRWYVGVIDRSTGSYKVLDVTKTIYQQIQKLSRDEEWLDPQHYDVVIVVDRTAGSQGYYTLIPKPHSKLSTEDIAIKNAINLDELRRRCVPSEPERVQAKIDLLKEKSKFYGKEGDAGSGNGAAKQTRKQKVAQPVVDESDYMSDAAEDTEDEEDYKFESVE